MIAATNIELQMPKQLTPIVEAITSRSEAIITSLALILIGILLSAILGRLLIRPWRHRMSQQARMVARKAIGYTVAVLVVVMVLQEFNVKLTALLGAAGIAGIAIGFAAQTSLSNMISGLFLLWEKPFQVGDVIQVNGQKGIVESIDLLSMTLRTFDNLSIRLPNEALVKGELINITRHPIRRYDIKLGVAYRENPDHVLSVLKQIARRNTFVLEEPEPLVAFTGFGESQLDFFLGVWHEKDDFIVMRNSILRDIKTGLEHAGIEIPYPHRVVVTTPQSAPASED